MRYIMLMTGSFACRNAKRLFHRHRAQGIPGTIHRVGLQTLRMLVNAVSLMDLRVPPANRLKALRGRRSGQYSIRVNDQYRICATGRPAIHSM